MGFPEVFVVEENLTKFHTATAYNMYTLQSTNAKCTPKPFEPTTITQPVNRVREGGGAVSPVNRRTQNCGNHYQLTDGLPESVGGWLPVAGTYCVDVSIQLAFLQKNNKNIIKQ